jgi:hypothetical protein
VALEIRMTEAERDLFAPPRANTIKSFFTRKYKSSVVSWPVLNCKIEA